MKQILTIILYLIISFQVGFSQSNRPLQPICKCCGVGEEIPNFCCLSNQEKDYYDTLVYLHQNLFVRLGHFEYHEILNNIQEGKYISYFIFPYRDKLSRV